MTLQTRRTLIHLSDLHIGLLNQATNSTITARLVANIISYYAAQNPKPIVAITGDLCDHGRGWARQSADLLRPLVAAGFTVLPIPGNHDYSMHVTWDDLGMPFWAFSQGGVVNISLEQFILQKAANGDRNHITGVTKTNEDVNSYVANLGPFLNGWTPGSIKVYREPSLSNVQCILLDGQDLVTNIADSARAIPKSNPSVLLQIFFMHDKSLRLARGYITPEQIIQFKNALTNDNEFRIVCLHHWVNYYRCIDTPKPDLAALILDKMQSTKGDGTLIGKPIARDIAFLRSMALLVGTAGLMPYQDISTFLKAVNAHIAKTYGTSYSNLNTTGVSSGYVQNPSLDGNHDTHKITNEADIFFLLDRCQLLLVGHRHKPGGLQDLRWTLTRALDDREKQYYAYKFRPQYTFGQILDFLNGIEAFRIVNPADMSFPFLSKVNVNGDLVLPPAEGLTNLRNRFIAVTAKLVATIDFQREFENIRKNIRSNALSYIHESDSSTKVQSWIELTLDLNNRSVTRREIPLGSPAPTPGPWIAPTPGPGPAPGPQPIAIPPTNSAGRDH